MLDKNEENNQVNGIHNHTSSRNSLTFGQRMADILTKWAGSWTFIVALSAVLAVWVAVNIFAAVYQWDPYPFILLNLFLSFCAAYQAPIILMSQRRVEDRDRTKAERDHAVNRKAEREIQNMQADFEELKAMVRKLDHKISAVLEKDRH